MSTSTAELSALCMQCAVTCRDFQAFASRKRSSRTGSTALAPMACRSAYLSLDGSSAMFSFDGTRYTAMSMPNSRFLVLQRTHGLFIRVGGNRAESCQIECTIAEWSKVLALPLRIECSAVVLSECSATFLPDKMRRVRREYMHGF